MAQSIFDKVCFQILADLFDNRAGMRFRDIKNRLTVSDPVVSNRLSLLKTHGLIEVSPVVEEASGNKYFVYRITKEGIKFAEGVDIKNLMEEVKQVENKRKSKP